MHFYLFLIGYYVGSAGGVCNDESHVIRSEAECLNALEKTTVYSKYSAYLASSNGNMYIGTNSNVPAGCSIKSVPKKPNFIPTQDLDKAMLFSLPFAKIHQTQVSLIELNQILINSNLRNV